MNDKDPPIADGQEGPVWIKAAIVGSQCSGKTSLLKLMQHQSLSKVRLLSRGAWDSKEG